jgi:hypothetical protein
MLWKWMPPAGDFQHLASWRELVVATALSLRRHHADTLIVSMSLIRDATGPRSSAAWPTRARMSCTSSWRRTPGPLRERLNARVTEPGRDWDQVAREADRRDEIVAAAARQPGGTLMLRSDGLAPAELADEVLTAASS